MKNPTRALLCLALSAVSLPAVAQAAAPSTPASAAVMTEAPPQLRGLLSTDGERLFSLVSPGGAAPRWVKLGAKFEGWELVDFKSADESLILKKEGRTLALRIEGSTIANAPAGSSGGRASLADAEEVLRKMDFERMMTRMMDQQKAAMVNMTRQMSAQGANSRGVDREEMAAFQKKVMETMFESMNFGEMKNDMAKVYSETFSHDELRGLSDFYSTPAGQAMVEKQPEVAQKLNEMIMPRMMAAMPKIQAMGKEFAAEQAKKRAAAAAEGGAPAAPSAPAPKQ